jgi:hypothetical protein
MKQDSLYRILLTATATGLLLSAPVYAEDMSYGGDPNDDEATPLLPKDETFLEKDVEAASTLAIGGTAGIGYIDNIYRSPNNEESDVVAVFRPGVRYKQDLKPYRFRLDGNLELGEFLDEGRNSYIDGDVKGEMAYDIGLDSKVYLDGRHRYDHVAIGGFVDDPSDQADEPTPYRYTEVGAGYVKDSATWVGLLDGRFTNFNYDNVNRTDQSRIINDDRDRNEGLLTGRLGYKFIPQTAFYVQQAGNFRSYTTKIDDTAINERDSTGTETLVGVAYAKPSDHFWADAGVGYMWQNYEDQTREDVDDFALRAAAQWREANLWRVRADLTRDVQEATNFGTSSYIQTRAGVRGDYLLDETWILGGAARYTINDFQINPAFALPKREDEVFDMTASIDYLITPIYTVGAEYLFVNRDSDAAEAEYTANTIMARVGVRY